MDKVVIRKKSDLGPLHDLLLDLCPPNVFGVKAIAILAPLLDVDAQYLYWLIRDNRQIPLKLARKLVAVSEGRVTLEELMERDFVARGPKKRTKQDLGPVQDLLLKACPPDENGEVSITKLANRMGITNQSIFRWCRLRAIPAKRAQQIVDASEGRISMDDVLPFVIGR